jgi:predicted porin
LQIFDYSTTAENMMNKKLITLAVSAAMAAPAAALAEATLYGRLNNSIDYVDVEQNAQLFGPGSVPYIQVPGVPLQPDNLFVTFDANGNPAGVQRAPGGLNTEWTAPADGRVFAFSPEGNVINAFDVFQDITYPVGNLDSRFFLPRRQDFKGWDLNANKRSNMVGVKGSEDLGGGLKAIYQVELQVYLTDRNNNIADGDPGTLEFRNTFVGLAGDWGTFLVGRHDTPLKISTAKLDLFTHTLADYNSTLGFANLRADNTVTYISPSFSGFQFAGAVVPSGGATPFGEAGTDAIPFGPYNLNSRYDRSTALGSEPDGIADAWSIAAIYSNGPFYASAAYESLGSDHWASTLEGQYFDPATNLWQTSYYGVPHYGTADDWSYWRIGLGLLDWNGFTIDGIYESHSNVYGAPTDSDMDIWQVQAAYAFGNNTIKGMYGQNDVDSCVGYLYAGTCNSAASAATGLPVSDVAYLNNRDFDSWAIGFDHNFSKRTRAYMLYTATDSDQKSSDWSGFSLGLEHKF